MWPFSKRKSDKLGPIEAALLNCRNFAAAEVSAHLAPWTFDGGFSNQEVASSLATVRSRSRDMAKNSEYFVRWLQLYVANIVGADGFRLKSFAEKSDTDMAVDNDAAYFIESHWAKWAKDPRSVDAGGQLDLPALLRLAVENWVRDGEAFILINRNAQNRYGISLRLIRPDCCDEGFNQTIDANTIVRCGVEIERSSCRPIAYYFDTANEDPASQVFGTKHRVRVPATDIIHLFTPHDAAQVRGFPMGHAFLKKLKMLDEFDQAELIAARDEVNTLGIFTAPAGRETEIKNLAKDGDLRNRLEAKSEPGSKLVLSQGWDYKPTHPNHPNAGLPAFKVSMLRDVASGGGVEYANFANDWSGVSFSSVRAGTLAERDQWLVHQANVITRVLDPLFDSWLMSFLSLRVSGLYGFGDYWRLRDHEFRGRRWQWVDPLRDVNAAVVAVEHGWKTDADIASDYGGDIDDNIAEAARVLGAKKAAGLSVGGDGVDNTPIVEEIGDGEAAQAEPQPIDEPMAEEDKACKPKAKRGRKSRKETK